MGSSGDGAKAGLVAGIPYGIVEAIIVYLSLVSSKASIETAIAKSIPPNSGLTANQLYSITLLIAPAVVVIFGVIGGLILGAIYGWKYEKIPGKTSMVKGLVLAGILWVLLSVLGGLGNLQDGAGVYLTQVGTGLGTALLFGFVLAYFYDRFVAAEKVMMGPT
ncbi:MAG: hypothetical protein OK456_06180 [Thaumarchaeota archaeon]|nr:hypothetical protein [Nitrososphaerota archaeon]